MSLPLHFICVQPATLYYAWQVEVMLNNFIDCGITSKYRVQCLFAYNKKEAEWQENLNTIKKLELKMREKVDFFYYEDTRNYPFSYISSIRPNLLKQHFQKFPQYANSAIFYHDCDIVFTKFPDFLENLLEDDMKWYVSDTKSYISHSYIQSKGHNVIEKMCEIVGVSERLIKEKEEESGGAQYLMKGVDWRFFEKVEKDCERLFHEINLLNYDIKSALSNIVKEYVGSDCHSNQLINEVKLSILIELKNVGFDVKEIQLYVDQETGKLTNATYHEVQIWCADMWAVLWGAWMRGFETKIIKELDFCWATDLAERWQNVYIYHNAGATKQNSFLFFKGDFIKHTPFLNSGENLDRKYASFKYFSIIKSIGKQSCLIELKEEDMDVDFLNLSKIKRAHMRFSTCKTCDKFMKTASGNFLCKLCGCQTENKILADENQCPDKKWSF